MRSRYRTKLAPCLLALLTALPCFCAEVGADGQLSTAIRGNQIEVLKAAVAQGADLNVRGDRDTTPLMYAAAFGSLEALRLLRAAGADVNAQNVFGATALMWSVTEPAKVRFGAPKLQVMPDALPQPLLSNLSVMSLELRASLLTARGKTGEAKELFAKAAQEEKALGYHEPPNYIRPVGETEGVAMMAVGNWADARASYERALVERPHSGLALYGTAMSSEKSGDSRAAAKEYAIFLSAWKNADPALPEVSHARRYLAGHPATAARL
jgi:tetratricopeptide (TPR) repeat protein